MPRPDVLVDLGRSHVRVVTDGVDVRSAGGAGLSDPGGPRAVAARIAAAVRAAAVEPDGARLVVGAPGVAQAPQLAASFAGALAELLPVRSALVASDSAAWHVGAFDGADGVVVALGTGAVAVVRQADTVTRLDGFGLLLGDVGGGAWIGLAALRRAIRAPGSVLHHLAIGRFGPPAGWPALLGAADVAGQLASFTSDVAAAAAGGDPSASAVLDDAAAGVAETLAAAPDDLPRCLVGGVAPVLASRLASFGRWVEPMGDAIDGLRLLADDPGPFAQECAYASHAAGVNPHETDALTTEQVAPGTEDLDTWPAERLVGRLVAGHAVAVPAVLAAAPALTVAVDSLAAALSGTGRLVYVGAGTSGRLAVQDAAELVPTFGLDPARAITLLAGGSAAGATAVEGAEDDEAAAVAAVDAARVSEADVVVGVSASGRTPYVRAALARARELGAVTVGIANVANSVIGRGADIAVELVTGPEVLAGSTRLAAGTAQKIALNTLTTAALIRTGTTYGPYMVDVRATNDKLRRRSLRIVRDAAGADEAAAAAALRDADGSVPVALTMLLADVDAGTARDRLAAAGSVRAAVQCGTSTNGVVHNRRTRAGG